MENKRCPYCLDHCGTWRLEDQDGLTYFVGFCTDGNHYLFADSLSRDFKIKIKCCPECGRKLDQGRKASPGWHSGQFNKIGLEAGLDLGHGGDFTSNGIEIIHHPSDDDLIKIHSDDSAGPIGEMAIMPSNLSYQEYDKRYREAHKND